MNLVMKIYAENTCLLQHKKCVVLWTAQLWFFYFIMRHNNMKVSVFL